MRPLRRLLLTGVAAAAFGAGVGALVLALADQRGRGAATAALLIVLAAAPCVGAHVGSQAAAYDLGARLRSAGVVFVATAVAGAAAILVAGGAVGDTGAGLVPAGAAMLALGVAAVLGSRGASAVAATICGAAVPALLAALVFLADPFIEWRGPDASSPRVARIVTSLSPLAAATSPRGGVDVDWLRMPLMYDGPEGSGAGLSVIGAYYPSRSPPAALWAACAALAGAVLVVVARRSRACLPEGARAIMVTPCS